MKRIPFLITLLALAAPSMALTAAEAPALRPGDYTAVCGDSITEQKMYSAFIEDYLIACQPAERLQVSQFGWGGETSWGFLGRMQNDVLPFKPQVMTLNYGMNDGDYRATDPAIVEKYRTAVNDIVRNFKKAGVREIVVGTPGPVDSTSFKGAWLRPPINATVYNETLAALGAEAGKVAAAEGVRFANVHAEGMRVMQAMKEKYGEKYLIFGDDGIHPKEAGHLVMAYAYLKALGCEGNIGKIEIDMGAGKATASRGHQVVSASKGTATIKSSRYPFCFTGDPAKPEATSGVIEFLPFNQDLNRFVLVVRNIPSGTAKLKVSWGDNTKEFSAEELGKGINLAAAFLENPFSGPFKKVHEAVLRQQRYETPMVKDLLHSVPDWKNNGVASSFDSFVKQLVETDARLREAAVRTVVPVTHTIRIE